MKNRSLFFKHNGFSLVELAIVVAILAILVAIALPDYFYMEIRAKRTEGIMLLENIRISETSYFIEYDTYTLNSDLLGEYGIIPITTQMRYYTVRVYNSDDPKFGYRCVAQGNLDHDAISDVLVLKSGDTGSFNSFNGYMIPNGISLYSDDAVL